VNDGIEGIIIPPNDLDALTAAILHLYEHPEIVERMGAAARARVVEHFTWEQNRERLLDAYDLVMRRARSFRAAI
jgi:glycosyltransferase involved in cell wall biosynthesis